MRIETYALLHTLTKLTCIDPKKKKKTDMKGKNFIIDGKHDHIYVDIYQSIEVRSMRINAWIVRTERSRERMYMKTMYVWRQRV